MPFRQLKSFFKILIGVQYERRFYKFQFARNGHVQRAISTERLAQAGYYSILDRCESLHLCD